MATRTAGVHHEVVGLWPRKCRQKRMKRFGRAVLFAVLVCGCSSSHPLDRDSSSSTTVALTRNAVSTVPREVAIALGHRMLDEAMLPSGMHSFRGSAPTVLRGPTVPGIGNLVFAHRLWTVDEAPHAVWQWLQVHVPRGFVKTESSSGTSRGVPSWGVEDDLSVQPPNISVAELQLAIAGDASLGTVIRGDTVVGWTEPRPADEFVPTTDRTVTVSVVHISPASPSNGPIGKRVSISDPTMVQPIARTFNGLHVTPPSGPNPGGPPGCGSVLYRVGFSATPTARPDVVATVGRCGGIDVTTNGRAAIGLDDLPKQEFATDAAHILGFTEPHFG